MEYTYNQKLKPWFSFEENGVYSQNDYFVFPISAYAWKNNIEANWKEIAGELESRIINQDKSIVPYFNRTLANSSEKWTVFPLIFWGKSLKKNQKKCPVTSRILREIPGVLTAGFSIMDKETHITPHVGDSNVFFRCHLGLKIPNQSQHIIGMRVGNENLIWEEGKLFSFCDAQQHEAWNLTNEKRYILIVDIIRPEFKNKYNFICAKMRMIAFLQNTFQRAYFFKIIPKFLRKIISNSLGIFYLSIWRLYSLFNKES
jgi:ornithine lipid ester-linked acyl 2-hydroxylase